MYSLGCYSIILSFIIYTIMKLHLPVRLFRAILALMVAVPSWSQAMDIPEEYTTIDLWTPSFIKDHISNADTEYEAFLLYTDVDFTPTSNTTWTATTPLMTGGNLIFTTAEGYDPMALTFANGKELVFYSPQSLTFDTLTRLTFTNNLREEKTSVSNSVLGGAVYIGPKAILSISHVDDNVENTTDILIDGNQVRVIRNSSSSAFACGGAFSGNSESDISFVDNNDIKFSKNEAYGSYNTYAYSYTVYASGGAIYTLGDLTFHNNGNVVFEENASFANHYSDNSVEATGGAVHSTGNAWFKGNENIAFINNRATATNGVHNWSNHNTTALGGALYASSIWDISENDNIKFENNYAKAVSSLAQNSSSFKALAYGGAIYSTSIINLSNNSDINFSGNYASADSHNGQSYYTSFSQGGAIYSTGSLSIRNNAEVTFRGNYTDNKYTTSYEGGAIYSTGSLLIEGNDDVVFEKNYERYGSSSYTYRLRSIYMKPDAKTDTLTLSAKEGTSITFNDSVYMGYYSGTSVSFNSDYVDADGVTQKATGDIIFSGAKTAEHLKEIKGSAGTSSEISNSQTSAINNHITLYGGTLQVVDGAKLNGRGITLKADSNAKLLMRNSSMGHSGYTFNFNNTTVLELEGVNTITASTLNLNTSSSLTTSVGQKNLNTAVLTLTGYLYTYEHTINLERTDGLTSGMFKIITLSSGSSYFKSSSNWIESKVTVNGSGYADRMIFSDLVWKDGTLYYNVGRNIWSNVSEDRLWNTTSDNWTMNSRSYTYLDGMDVYFTDTGAGEVALVGDINAASIEVNNASGKDYHFTASVSGGKLVGSSGILKNGAGALTIDTANEHTGATVLNTGTLNVHHSTALGATASATTATVTTKTGTLLAVDENSHVILAAENSIAGAVSVAEGSTLEMRNTGYKASASTVGGTLHFVGSAAAMSNVGTLSGTGTVKVEDSTITFSEQSNYSGNFMVEGDGATLNITKGHYAAAGYLSVQGSGAALNMSGYNINMKTGGRINMSTDGTTSYLAANNVTFITGSGLTVRHDGNTEALTLSCYNENAAGTMNVAKLTFNSGASYTADGGHLNLNNGELTLAITTTATQKIHLTLSAGQVYDDDMRVCLFSGVGQINLIYDNIVAGTSGYTLNAENYFSGDWINADTQLIFENGSLYLSGVNSVGLAADSVAWSNTTGDYCWNTNAMNWVQNAASASYKDNVSVVFGDAGCGEVTLEGDLAPASVLVNNSYASDYSWVGTGSLVGNMSLTKQGMGTLTIETENSYRGGTTIEGGVLVANHASALGTGIVQLNGGTLEIGTTGITNTLRSSGRSTLAVSEGVTHKLLGTINNTGTLSMSGSFDATALGSLSILNNVSLVNAAGQTDATGGFNKSALHGVQIATGSTVDLGTSITHSNNVLHLGTDGWATMGGLVEYSGYQVGTGHNVKLSDVVNVATAGGSSMTNIQLSGGTLTADTALTGVLLASGTSTIVAQDWAVKQAFSNSGSLTISGSIVADGIESVEVIGSTYVDASGKIGTHGFNKNDGSKFTLVLGGGVTATDLSITRNGVQYTLGSDGVAVAEGAVAYGRYLVGAGHSVKLSEVQAAAVSHGVSKTDIELNGGTITMDRATSGLVTAAGNSKLVAQNWEISSTITNSGVLTLSGSMIADAMNVETQAASFVDTEGNIGLHGFSKAEGHKFTLVEGGSVVTDGLTITRKGINYVLGSNGVAVSDGDIAYDSYIIGNGHNAKLSDIVRIAAAHGVNSTAIQLNGGTLTADSTLTGLLTVTGESTLVAQNLALTTAIVNTGELTLSGTVDAGALELNETAAARVSLNDTVVSDSESGFAKSVSYSAVLVDGGAVIDRGLVILHSGLQNGLSLQLGSDGVAHAGGTVDYSTYYLTGHGVADVNGIKQVSQNHGCQLQGVNMDGGTLTVNSDVTVNGTGGALLLNSGTLSGNLSGVTLNAAGGHIAATLSGGNTLVGNQFVLTEVLQNNGTLTVSGNFDASALELTSSDTSYVDATGKAGNSGFLKSGEYRVLVINGGEVNGKALVKHGDYTLTMNGGGYATMGGDISYGTYYLNTGDAVNVSTAEAASANALTSVKMTGGVLYADASTDVQATGGSVVLSSGTLTGSLQNTAITASAGALNATLSGLSTLTVTGTVSLSGDNSHTGGTVMTGGNLTLAHASALGGGSLITTGNNTLNAGTTVALTSAIMNNGALTLNGVYDVSALQLIAADAGYVDVHGNSGVSGFYRSGGYSVQVVNGGTVDGSATIKHGSLTLTMGSNGYANCTGDISYDTYYLNGSDTVNISAAEVASGNALTTVTMTGGTLNADATTTVNATGGNIVLSNGTLSGTIKNTSVNVTAGTLSATLSGTSALSAKGNITISGANTHTGGTSFTGGNITLSQALALGEGIITASGVNTIAATTEVTLNSVILNSGALTLTGTYNAGALSLESMNDSYVDVNGYAGNSGFISSGGYRVQVVNGGSVNGAATIKHGSHTLTLGDDGYAISSGSVSYDTYYLNGNDSVSVSAAETASSQALTTVTMTGGTLYADATTTVNATGGNIVLSKGVLSGTVKNTALSAGGGTVSATLSGTTSLSATGMMSITQANTHTGGTSFNGGTFTLNHASALGQGRVMCSGTNTLSTSAAVMLQNSILNSGSLTLLGSYDVTALQLSAVEDGYVDLYGNADTSGFYRSGGYSVQVVNGGSVNGSATIKHGNLTLTLGNDGYATAEGGISYDTYYLNGTDTVNVSAAEVASANKMTSVTMTGGTLYADASTTVNATGGNIELSNGTLSGTIKNTAINVTAGTLTATLSGTSSLTAKGNITISGANTHTGGTTFSGGNFTLSQASALGNGAIMASGVNTIAATTEVTLNSVILNSGALTLTGTYNASALSLESVNAGYVDINGHVGESGFYKTDGCRVLVVNGGTVSGGATVKHGSHTLTLGADGYATSGETITYSTYYLNGADTVSVSAAEAASANALTTVSMKGGTLYADATTTVNATGGNIELSSGTLSGTIKNTAINATAGTLSATLSGSTELSAKGNVTISGANTHTGSTSFMGGTFTLKNASALGNGSVLTSNDCILQAGNGVTLKSAILNSGTLTLSGKWNISDLAINTQAATRIDIDGSQGDSGFVKSASYEVQVVMGGTTQASGLTLTHSSLPSGKQFSLGANGLATAGGEVDYSTYYLTGNDSLTVSRGESVSGGILSNVVMTGGHLTVDATTTVNATGGRITITDDNTLSGSIVNTDVTLAGGHYDVDISAGITGDSSLTINGGNVTLSGNNNYSGGTIINGGSLTAEDKSVLGSGSITVNGGTLDLNNQQVGNDITLNNGTLVGNDNYNGNLSIGGDNVMVEGGYTLSAGKVLEIAAGGTEFTSDLTLSGGTLLFRGAPLTVDGDVSFAEGTTTLVDLRSWEGQLTDGLTLAVLGSDVSGWFDGCMELIGMNNMSLAFDSATGSLTLQIAGAAPVVETITWLGAKGMVWQAGKAGWMNSATGFDSIFVNGSDVIFSQPGTVKIVGSVEIGSMIVAGDKAISFKADKLNPGRIEGDGSLIKRGLGKLTMNDGNTYTGGTVIEVGTLVAGGANSFGRGDITISGGTLDLKSKAVANDIELVASGIIKGGKKYIGAYTQTSGELKKGSVLNIAESATISGGVVNGTLSGTGTVTVTGDAEIGATGKVTTNGLDICGSLAVSNKGLAMNTKSSAITVISGGELISEGQLKAADMTVNGGLVEIHSTKASTIAITNNMNLTGGATMTVSANVKAGNMTMTGSQLTLGNPVLDTWAFRPSIGTASAPTLSLTVKGTMQLKSSSLTLSGKISASNLSITDSYVNMTSTKLKTIAVKNTLTLSGDNCVVFNFDATDGKTYKLFTFKGFTSDGSSLHELLGWEDNGSYTLTATAKAITLTILDASAWEAYMDELASAGAVAATSEDDELTESGAVESATYELARPVATDAAIDPMLGKVADTLVQSTWGTAGASRAFGDTIAARGTHATALADGKAAAWISTMGGSSRISSDGAHAGADATLTGAAFGMEARLSEKSTVGLAIGNSWGKVSTFSAFPVDQDSTHQGIYGKHMLGSSTTLSWMAAHTRTESDAKLAGLPCDWTQDALQLDARVDKLFALSDRTTVSAFVGMQYLATDKGECGGLSTGSLQNLRGEIGVSAAHKATDKTYVYGELSFIGDMVRNNPTATVGDYRSRGANPGRAGLNLSVGASYQLNDSWSLNGSYSLELMQNQTSHSANVGATYSF